MKRIKTITTTNNRYYTYYNHMTEEEYAALNPGKTYTDISDKAFDKKGVKYEKTAVGDKYVSENMTANNYSLGGEQSGHIIFSKYATTGDGILTSLLMMEVMLEKKQSLAKLTEEVKIYPQLMKNVRVADKKKARENAAVVEAIAKVTEELGDSGRILVRESGTEPVIRVMVEAESDELCAKYVKQVIDVICSEGLIVLE